MGMRDEFGVDSMMTRGSRSGWNRRDILVSFGGVIIAGTAPGVLLLAVMPPPSELEVHPLKLVMYSPSEVNRWLRTRVR